MGIRFLVLLPVAVVIAAPTSESPAPATIARSQAEYAAAQAEARRLQAMADRASDALDRLRAEQRAAAANIEATEARITLADLRLRQAAATLRSQRLALADAQRPVAALLAGVAMMGERPPVLALLDEGSIDSLVQTRILLDSTLPVIRSRSAAFAGRLASAERALACARTAQNELKASRAALDKARSEFNAIEAQLLDRTARTGAAALEASDRVLAVGEASKRAVGDYRGAARCALWPRHSRPAPPSRRAPVRPTAGCCAHPSLIGSRRVHRSVRGWGTSIARASVRAA